MFIYKFTKKIKIYIMNRKTIKHRRDKDYDCNHKPYQICEEFSCVVLL